MNNYILVDGKPTLEPDILRWAQWFFETSEDRVVKQETVGDLRISTVFLGIDHNWSSQGPPLLFETMVFGHARTVERVRLGEIT